MCTTICYILIHKTSFNFFIAQAKSRFYAIYSFVQSTTHENAHTNKQYKYQWLICLDSFDSVRTKSLISLSNEELETRQFSL